MLNMNTVTGFGYALLASVLLGNAALAAEDMPSPLDVDQHPASPSYESLFTDEVVPLDAELSWKNRFRGDETFNSDEKLPPTSSVLEHLSNRPGSGASGESMPGGFDASGVVRQVKLSEGKIKVEHGPIDRLGMPGMTMMFRVEDPAQLAGLDKGSEIDFDVDNTAAGFSITRLAMKSSRFDATGVVKQVKMSEGKLKIEHGPIDRLGMPGMTMIFRVEDPKQMANIEKGSEIEFNVDNTASGFTITGLRLMGGDAGDAFDASGTVKSIRADQGKVKIEHGPIDRLGMPGDAVQGQGCAVPGRAATRYGGRFRRGQRSGRFRDYPYPAGKRRANGGGSRSPLLHDRPVHAAGSSPVSGQTLPRQRCGDAAQIGQRKAVCRHYGLYRWPQDA